MAVTFDKNPRFIATAIPYEVVGALKGFNGIKTAFYDRICSSALIVIHDLLVPIMHGLQSALNNNKVDLITLPTLTLKS